MRTTSERRRTARNVCYSWKTVFFFVILTGALAVPAGVYAQAPGAGSNSLRNRVAALEQHVAALEAALAALQNNTVLALDGVLVLDTSGISPIARFIGVNVQVVNGAGSSSTTNGLGNLIVGYDELPPGNPPGSRNGSHNLVVGRQHQYPSFGGLVAGFNNVVSGQEASVVGGSLNNANGTWSSVTAGRQNVATGMHASVTGGEFNNASGAGASVSGGSTNQAGGDHASVSGGHENFASGVDSSVSGGELNEARGAQSGVSGGISNLASGRAATVSGGRQNNAGGIDASVSGGQARSAPVQDCWKAGSPADTC